MYVMRYSSSLTNLASPKPRDNLKDKKKKEMNGHRDWERMAICALVPLAENIMSSNCRDLPFVD